MACIQEGTMSKRHTCPSIWCDDKCKVTDRDRLVEVILKNMKNALPSYRNSDAEWVADALIADGWIRKKP